MTMIVLEGNECQYKTTIANKLSEKLGLEVVKGSSFETATKGNDYLFRKSLDLANMDDVILDRFVYSNKVYATLKKDYAILSDDQIKVIEDKIFDKAIIVYLHAPHEVLIERLNERGDEYIKSDELESINKEYEKVMHNVKGMFMVHYDTSLLSSGEIADKILNLKDTFEDLNNSIMKFYSLEEIM